MSSHPKAFVAIVIMGAVAIAGLPVRVAAVEDAFRRETCDARGTKGRIPRSASTTGSATSRCAPTRCASACAPRATCWSATTTRRTTPKRFASLKPTRAAVRRRHRRCAYLLNGPATGFPGAIVAVIDESKGGDAIVALEGQGRLARRAQGGKVPPIAFTPGSPSEHLLRRPACTSTSRRSAAAGTVARRDQRLARGAEAPARPQGRRRRACGSPTSRARSRRRASSSSWHRGDRSG